MKFQKPARQAFIVLIGIAAFAFAAPCLKASLEVTLDTSNYAGQPADVLFDFTAGGGPPSNTVTISNLTGASVIFAENDTGAVTGSLPAATTLSDSSFFSEAGLDLVLGNTLTFDFASTNVAPGAAFPDEFAFYVMDFVNPNQTLLPSTDPTGAESLLTIDLVGGSSPSVSIYSDLLTTGPIPSPPPVSAVPEPASVVLMATLLLLPLACRRARIRLRRSLPAAGAVVSIAALSLICLPAAQAQNIVTGVGQDPNFSVTFSGLRLNRTTDTFVTVASITNNSTNPIDGPFYIGITNISSPDVTLAYGGGNLQDGFPFAPLSGVQAILGGQTVTAVLSFNNPDLVAFTIGAKIYDAASAPPVATLQCPQPQTLAVTNSIPVPMTYTPPTDSLGRVASCTPASGTLITQGATVSCMSTGGASLPASCSFIQYVIPLTTIVIQGGSPPPPPPPPQPPFEAQLAIIPCAAMAPAFAPGNPLPTNLDTSEYCETPEQIVAGGPPAGQATFTIWNYGPYAATNASITLSFGPFVTQQAWNFSQLSTCYAPVQVGYPFNVLNILGGVRYGYNETCSFADIAPNTGVNVTAGIDVQQGEEAPDIQASITVDPTQNTDPDTGDMAVAVPVSPGPLGSITVPLSVSQRITQQNGCNYSNEPGFAILLNTCGVPTAVTTGLVAGFLGAASLITGAGGAAIDFDVISTTDSVIFNSIDDVGFIR